MSNWHPTSYDFDHPTTRLLDWLNTLVEDVTKNGKTRYITPFMDLLRRCEEKLGIEHRSLHALIEDNTILRTLDGYDLIEIRRRGNIYERKFPENPEETRREQTHPTICSESCPAVQCPYRNPEHYGQECEAIWSKFENEKMNTVKPKNINEVLLRSMNPNDKTEDTPDYKSPMSSSNMKTSEQTPSLLKGKTNERSLAPQ